MTSSYSNLVYLHDLLESIIEHDVTFVMTLLQAHIEDDWVRKITYVSYTNKEEPLPNGRRIDVFYKARNFRKTLCLGFEIKTGNEVDEKQLREEMEGLKSVKECEETFLILIALEDPKYNIPYYFIPLSAFQQKINDVTKIVYRFVKEFEERD
ncbi:hypothetical protein [Saccharolobus islandicus]|uniref:Uncharacterized protein n=2 Tax=Saccharolobus islandicus TaxID=43080 RepID=C4KI15_SACI6|nr:hypothetical protein [Sulfolobus islandicus]ACR42229.1 conserved hypothetical protein [Sulfolobus islandicus M.16.4]